MEELDNIIDDEILSSIQQLRYRLRNGGDDDDENKSRLLLRQTQHVNRESVDYFVDFLKSEESSRNVKELELSNFSLVQPADGGLEVLRDFFANDTTLTKAMLWHCRFGGEEENSRILSAFETNTSVVDLEITRSTILFHDLGDAALGNCLSGILQNNTHLQRLRCSFGRLNEQGPGTVLRAFQPGLRTNRHLKELDLLYCGIDDECICIIANALAGNTTLETLNLGFNDITSLGLDDVTRLVESTHIRKIDLFTSSNRALHDNAATERFSQALSRSNFLKTIIVPMHDDAAAIVIPAFESVNSLEEAQFGEWYEQDRLPRRSLRQLITSLPRIKGLRKFGLPHWDYFLRNPSFVQALCRNTSLEELLWLEPEDATPVVNNVLARNSSMNRADALLALQPRTRVRGRVPIPSKSGIWCMAFAKMGAQPSDGSSNDDANENSDIDAGSDNNIESDSDLGSDTDIDTGNDTDTEDDTAAVTDSVDTGASAIFKILQARPAILEKQLKQPANAATATSSSHGQQRDTQDNNNVGNSNTTTSAQKRPRLS